MQSSTIELYGGPLDGANINIPEDESQLATVISLPLNPNPDDGFYKPSDIGKQWQDNCAIYIRTSTLRFKFKEMTNGDTDLSIYE